MFGLDHLVVVKADFNLTAFKDFLNNVMLSISWQQFEGKPYTI